MNKASVWKFAMISDTQGGRGIEGQCINKAVVDLIAADIVKEKPDLVLMCGDLVNGWMRNFGKTPEEQYAEWKAAMKPVFDAKIPVYPVRGNHDDGPERLALPPLPARLEPPEGFTERLRKAYIDAFKDLSHIPENGPEGEKRMEYSFSHKNAFFIGLDLYSIGQHRVNLDWVEEQLAGNTLPHVFVYGHEPAFETKHKDNLSFYEEERNRFWNDLGRAGCRTYFCGHDHLYNRALILDDRGNEVRQIIAGTGGGGLRKWNGTYKNPRVQGEFHCQDFHGYLIVTVDGANAELIWKALTDEEAGLWEIKDNFSWSVASVSDKKY